jgi:putative endonuclease
MYTVYILYSEKINRFYIGYTSDLITRLDFHLNDDQARKFTYKADDWTLFYRIECQSKAQATSIERHIKSMKSKVYIKNFLKYPDITAKLLEKYRQSDC